MNARHLLLPIGLLFLVFFRLDAQWIGTSGAQGPQVNDIVPLSQAIFAGSGGGVLISTDGGSHWTSTSLMSCYVNSLIAKQDTLFAAVWEGRNGVYRSADYGSTWVAINDSLPSNVYVQQLAMDGNLIFAGTTTHGLFVSSNSCSHWQHVVVPLTFEWVYALGFCDSSLFISTEVDGVLRSPDHGQSWKAVNDGLPSQYIPSSYCVNDSGFFCGALAGKGIYRTTDHGDSWSATNTSSLVHAMVGKGGKLIVATWGDGVLLSENGGARFAMKNDGLPTMYISTVAIIGNELFAGTDGDGIWRRPLSEFVTSVNADLRNTPPGFALEQNYPNPFNPTTSIGYTVGAVSSQQTAVRSRVGLAVYDLLGREVAVLVDERKTPGNYEVKFNASGLASGVYIYRLTTNGYIQCRKLMLLK
jgi:photosystem II stability/assembly factor-like uncharacterized protein